MQLIGAAFPRTGTMSIKHAIEMLGVGPCYHMHELFLHPEHIPLWMQARQTSTFDWTRVMAGYQASLDTPACLYWRELADYFPQAKVLLTVRDPSSWYDSIAATIHPIVYRPESAANHALAMVKELFFESYLQGQFLDKKATMQRYTDYCNEVRQYIDPARLVEYSVAQGWPALCEIFQQPVPNQDFPRSNSRADFRERNESF